MNKYAIVNLYNMYNGGELMQLQALVNKLDGRITLISLYSIVDTQKCKELGIKYTGAIKPNGKIKTVVNIGKVVLSAVLYKIGVIRASGILRDMLNADLIIDMGGDTFSDYPSVYYSIIHSISLILALLLGKKYVILSQTIGKFNIPITKRLARYVLSRATYIIVREYHTLNYLINDMKIKSELVKLVPDIGYLYPSRLVKREQNTIGLLTSSICKKQGGIDIEQNIELLTYIGQYYSAKGYKIYLIPHVLTAYANIGVNKNIDDSEIAIILAENIDNSEIIDYNSIGRASVVIGSRLHGCINALNTGVPVIALAYSNKFYTLEGNVQILDIKKVVKDNMLVIDACNKILG